MKKENKIIMVFILYFLFLFLMLYYLNNTYYYGSYFNFLLFYFPLSSLVFTLILRKLDFSLVTYIPILCGLCITFIVYKYEGSVEEGYFFINYIVTTVGLWVYSFIKKHNQKIKK